MKNNVSQYFGGKRTPVIRHPSVIKSHLRSKLTNAPLAAIRILVLLFACSSGAQLARAQDYAVTNLGSINSWVQPKGINASGQVAFYDYISGEYRTFFYDGATAQDIGSFGGPYTIPLGLNASGQVVGYSYTSSGYQHAFAWTQSGGMVDLTFPGGTYSYAYAVNDSGVVVGYSRTSSGYDHAFAWTQSGGMVDLGTLPGGTYSYAFAVNDSGVVVGYSQTSSGYYHAFAWTQSGGMVDLGTFPGGTYSYASAVNDSGVVVGYSQPSSGYYHAFAWTQSGGMVDLGTLPGGTYSYASAVNDSGVVVGYSYTSSGYQHAFAWTQSGGMVDLTFPGGTYSYAYAVNDSGVVVGYSETSSGYQHAFAWTQSGGMVDLNLHIPTAPAGMELYYGIALSDNGSIVAYGNTGTVLLGGSSTAPVLGPIAANDPVAKNIAVAVSAQFTDANTADTHTAEWTWGDGSLPQAGMVSETGGAGTASGSHPFAAAGIYKVSLTVTDSTGHTATVSRDIVVYDPSAGFVTGGGWINSPAGAYKEDESLAGRATFGFVSKYLKGANVPTGNTEFQFQAAKLNFHSDNYYWLVVAGARAQYKGTGTINGLGSYEFLLTAIDGQVNGGGGVDRFRIKIWYYDATLQQDIVVYDNQIDSSTIGSVNEGTKLGGGSIVIHK